MNRPEPATSLELLQDDPAAWRPLDDEDRASWLREIESSGSSILHDLRDVHLSWRVHDGDLTIPSPLISGHPLVINGNLTIRGFYDDDGLAFAGYGFLVVLGDLLVDDVLSRAGVHVAGSLTSSGLVAGYDNDFSFTVVGEVSARGLFFDDHMRSVGSAKTDFDIETIGFNGGVPGYEPEAFRDEFVRMLQLLDPAVIDLGAVDDGQLWELQPASGMVQARLGKGRSLFRQTPAPEDLVETLEAVLGSLVPAPTFDQLLEMDPLAARLAISWLPDWDRNTSKRILEEGPRSWLDAMRLNYELRSWHEQVEERLASMPD